MTVVRILIWNLADSSASVADVRERVEASPGVRFLWNEGQERFGLVALVSDVPELGELVELIGHEPEVAEEYDTD